MSASRDGDAGSRSAIRPHTRGKKDFVLNFKLHIFRYIILNVISFISFSFP